MTLPALFVFVIMMNLLATAIPTQFSKSPVEQSRAEQTEIMLHLRASVVKNYQDQWNSSVNHCKWEGVSCTSKLVTGISFDNLPGNDINILEVIAGMVCKLSTLTHFRANTDYWFKEFLHELELTRSFPHKILDCANLEYLELDGWRMSGMLPINMSLRLPNLKSLSLQLNAFHALPHDFDSLLCGTHLEELYLSSNKFNSTFPWPKQHLRCSRLKVLDLGGNHFEGRLPPNMTSVFPNIEEFDLGGNMFTGVIIWSDLMAIPSLKHLDLSNNEFSKLADYSLNNVSYRSSLTYLDLSSNQLNQGFLRTLQLSNLTQLQDLTLDDSNLTSGDIKDIDMCNMGRLVSISLTGNTLTSIPKCLINLPHLNNLYLDDNSLTGSIPPLDKTNLTVLYLSNNHLTGPIPAMPSTIDWLHLNNNNLTGFSKSVSAVLVDLSYNYLMGNIQSITNALNSNIEDLDVSYNKLSGSLPSNMSDFINLVIMDLSNNLLSGSIQASTFGNLTHLAGISLRSNKFSGPLQPLTFSNLSSLETLDLSNNSLSGPITHVPQNLKILMIEHNSFTGTLPHSLASAQYVFAGHNNLTGDISYYKSFFTSNTLEQFSLPFNGLHGSLPSNMSSPTLTLIDLQGNQLFGQLPTRNNSIPGLRVLNLANNFNMTGSIPYWIWKLENLQVLVLSNNHFSGSLPNSFQNCLPGFQVPAIGMTITSYGFIESLEVTYFDMQTTIKERKNEKTYYENIILDLSNNKFQGSLPADMETLVFLRILNLSRNNFSGEIPPWAFNTTSSLEAADFSHNNLTGTIPASFDSLTKIVIFNVAFNNLSGHIPTSTQFDTFNSSMFEGNPGLCGRQVSRPCTDHNSTVPANLDYTGEGDSKYGEGMWEEMSPVAFALTAMSSFCSVLWIMALTLGF